jgi:hypothetical protein
MSVAMPQLRVRSRLRAWLRFASRQRLSSRSRPILKTHHPVLEQLESRETTNLLANPLMPNLLDPGDIRLVNPQLGDSRSSDILSSYLARPAAELAPIQTSVPSAPTSPSSGSPQAPSASTPSFSQDTSNPLATFSTDLFSTPTGPSSSMPNTQSGLPVTSISSNGGAASAGSGLGLSTVPTAGGGATFATSSSSSGSADSALFAAVSASSAKSALGAGLPTPSPALGAGFPTPSRALGAGLPTPSLSVVPTGSSLTKVTTIPSTPVSPPPTAGPPPPIVAMHPFIPDLADPVVRTNADSFGGDPMGGAFSEAGVRYGDGAVQLSFTDLSSSGFGMQWGQTRFFTNINSAPSGSPNGNGMGISQLPFMSQSGSTLLVETSGTTTSARSTAQPSPSTTSSRIR